MSLQPEVSIVLIFLNEARFITEAIDSVVAQTFSNWELLLVDDGSTDESATIARSYAARFPDRVRYIEHEGHANKGMSASRNLGIQQACGASISFIDGDDVWRPRKLERQVALLQEHPEAGMVTGRAEWWYSWSGKPEDRDEDFVQELGVPLDDVVPAPALLTAFLADPWASIADILVRREVVAKVGGYEAEFRGMYEDQVFHAKLCAQFPIYVSSASWYRYRQHDASCVATSDAAGKKQEARKRYLTWLEGWLQTQNIT